MAYMSGLENKIKKIQKKVYCFRIRISSKFLSLFGYITLIGFWGIGDCCYELAYIDDFKKQVNKKIRVVAFKNKAAIFEFYKSIDKVSLTSKKAALYFAEFGKKCANNQNHLIYIAHMGYSGKFPDKMKAAYGLEHVDKLTFPVVNEVKTNVIINSIIVNAKSNWYSSSKIERFMVELIKCAQNKGLHIYVNSPLPDNLKSKNNVEEVFWDLEYFYNAAKQVKAVISIRTGLLDFIINSNANVFCLYDKTENGNWLFEVFNLDTWNCRDARIFQYFVEDIIPEDIIEML